MQEAQIEDFLEQHPYIIEEGLKILDRQRRTEFGIIDLLCKDKTGKYVVIEIKIDPDYPAIAQIGKYIVSLEKEGIPREEMRGILVTQYIDREVQELCNYFNIETKGIAIGKPTLPHSVTVREHPRKITRTLTKRESSIIQTINKCNAENRYATYEDLSKESNLSAACLRGYISGIIKKGVPIAKKKLKTGIVLFQAINNQQQSSTTRQQPTTIIDTPPTTGDIESYIKICKKRGKNGK